MDPPSHTISHPDSPPSGRPNNRDDDCPLPPVPNAKLRHMCSYGGHIIPRPHDKSLCYVGGDTRIVVVDRHSSLPDFHSRLSHSILNGRHFTLKYQLPNEDLDSLISLATDEDLENMIEEYDRTTSASPLRPSRLRLFLFPSKPETAVSMGCLLDDAKSETWFVDALNGAGLLPRGLSDSAAVDNLLELENGDQDIEVKNDTSKSTVMETSSSFGSSLSSPSMGNLPPIMVRVEDYGMVGLDDEFARGVSVKSGGVENDDKSTAPTAGLRRKPPLPLPLQPVQRKFVDVHNLGSPDSKNAGNGNGGCYNLPSPDSVTSDCSIASAGSQLLNRENRVPSPAIDQNTTSNVTQDPIPTIPVQQQHLVDHQNQQQFIQHSSPDTQQTHYIQHSPLPISSYYPIYTSPQNHHDPHNYPMYFVPPPNTNTPTMLPSYQTTTGPTQMMVQVPTHQFQSSQYVGHQQMAHVPPPQANAIASSVNYGYEYSQHMQDQMYYAQHVAASQPPPPQYLTMTPAAAAAILSQQSSAQLPGDNNAQQS